MSLHINAEAWRKLLLEDLDWLKQQRRTLERDHIIDILKTEIENLPLHEWCGKQPRTPA